MNPPTMTRLFVSIAPRPAPVRMEGARPWLRNNLFSSVGNTLVSVIMLVLLAWAAKSGIEWAVINAVTAASYDACQAARGTGACWGVIREKGLFILLGRYPLIERWRTDWGVAIEPLRSRFGTPGETNAGLLGYLESVEG